MIEQPASAALAPERSARNTAFGLLLLTVALSALAGATIAGQLARPLAALTLATGLLKHGESEVPLPRGGSSEIRALVATFGAMRERLATRAAERERLLTEVETSRTEAVNEKNRFAAVLGALPVGVAVLDAQGGVVSTNPAYEQVWSGPLPVSRSVSDYVDYKAWWVDTGEPVQPEEWAAARVIQKGEAVLGHCCRFSASTAAALSS